MEISINSYHIDEINMYNNGNDTFLIEINMSDKEGKHFKMEMPSAKVNLSIITEAFNKSSIKLEIEGDF